MILRIKALILNKIWKKIIEKDSVQILMKRMKNIIKLKMVISKKLIKQAFKLILLNVLIVQNINNVIQMIQ